MNYRLTRRLPAILLLLSATAAGFFFLRQQFSPALVQGQAEPDALRPAELGAPVSDEGLSEGSAKPAVQSLGESVSLPSALVDPPLDSSVLDILAALDARARTGDVLAACRIVSELMRCKGARAWTPQAEKSAIDRIAAVAKEGDDIEVSARQLEAIISQNNRAKAACEGVGEREYSLLPHYLLAGGRAGHVPAMVLFANARTVGGEALIADPGLYASYRLNAWPLFLASFEAGHPDAVYSWHWALRSNGFAYFAGVIPEAWRTPGVALALQNRLMQEQGAAVDAVASADLSAADLAKADELYARYFENSAWLKRRPPAAPSARKDVNLWQLNLGLEKCEPPQ